MALTVDFWQTFEGTLDASGLAANDHSDSLTSANWGVDNANGRLSVGAGAEFGTGRLINGTPDGGSQGLIYDCTGSSEGGTVTLQFPGVSALSMGFWCKLPSTLIGTFTEHDLITVLDAVDDHTPIIKVAGWTAELRLSIFAWQQGYSDYTVIPADTWLWITIGWEAYGLSRVRIYDTDGNQVGAERTRDAGSADMVFARLGSWVGSDAHSGNILFDDWVGDFTSATFPLGPPMAASGPSIPVLRNHYRMMKAR